MDTQIVSKFLCRFYQMAGEKYSLKHEMKWARMRLKAFVATTIIIDLCICATAVIFICIFTFFYTPTCSDRSGALSID